jgi:hypothetical protein
MRTSQNTIETISTIGIDVGKDKPDVLDPAGGTDIFHMVPGRVKLTAATDAMRCLSLSNKVLRWYTECCRTPIANTPPGPGFPVIGMVHSFMDHGTDSCSRDEVLGPPLCSIYESSAIGPLPRHIQRGGLFRLEDHLLHIPWQDISAHVPMRLNVSAVGSPNRLRHRVCDKVPKRPQS